MLLSFMRTWRATGLCSNQQLLLLCKQQVRLMYVLLLLLMYKMVMSIHLEGGRERARHLKYSHRGLAEIMGGLLSLTALDDNY
jgi:hypothetical protein